MLPLNYHHLYYFWVTAKAGRVSEASRTLLLSQSALSTQVQQLERSFAKKLFVRGRRGVTLTADGRIAFDYCERIFSQGEELASAMQSGAGQASPRLRLGVAGAVSKHVMAQILERIHAVDRALRVRILGGTPEGLRDRLESHKLDLVVSNVDFSSALGLEFRAYLAGSVPVRLVGVPGLRRQVRRFPADLARVPMMLTGADNPSRKEIDLFLCRHKVSVAVEAEIEDSELMLALALRGHGVAAVDALTAEAALAEGRLVRLDRGTLRVRQHVWLIAGRHPKPNPVLQAALESLMEGFRIAAPAAA